MLNDSNSSEVSCIPTKRPEYIAYMLICLAQISLNAVIIHAVAQGRRILRHNYVYAYVSSTLAANLVYGIGVMVTLLYDFIASYSSPESLRLDLKKDQVVMGFWAFRKSIFISTFLIMSGNIAGLIYGLRESTYFVNKYSRKTISREQPSNKSVKKRKVHAVVFIALIWIIPCVLAFIPIFDETCMKHCKCKPATYDVYICQSDKKNGCSTTGWVPIPTRYIKFIVTVWFILACGIGLLLPNAIYQFGKTMIMRGRTFESERILDVIMEIWKRKIQLSHTIKLLILITVFYVVLFIPSIVMLLFDILSLPINFSFSIVSSSYMLALVYTFVSPILMVKYMPSLKNAVSKLFRARFRVTTNSTISSVSNTDHSKKKDEESS